MEEKWFQPHEFARIVGMTKRALRYYREKEILVPELINQEGHTFYSEKNLFEAQQISTLRYLGFSVEKIKEIQKEQVTVEDSLKLQKDLLEEKIIETRRLISAIEEMEATVRQQKDLSWENMFHAVKGAKHESVEKSMLEYYDARAEEYDDIFSGGGPASCKPHVYRKDITALFELLSGFGEGKVIDIGCGTGYWLKAYYQRCREFTFLDAAPNMLRKCRERVQHYQLMNCAEFIKEDFFKWEQSPTPVYDCAVAGFLLGHFTEEQITQFFEKIRLILRPKGKLVVIDNTWSKWRAKDEHKEDIERRRLSDDREFLIYKKYFEEEEIRGILEKHQIRIENIYWGLNFFGVIGQMME